jgi:hypothetical protein
MPVCSTIKAGLHPPSARVLTRGANAALTVRALGHHSRSDASSLTTFRASLAGQTGSEHRGDAEHRLPYRRDRRRSLAIVGTFGDAARAHTPARLMRLRMQALHATARPIECALSYYDYSKPDRGFASHRTSRPAFPWSYEGRDER